MSSQKMIENFQEETTVYESTQNLVAFSFDLFTGYPDNSIIGDDTVQLQWTSADTNYTCSRGVRTGM